MKRSCTIGAGDGGCGGGGGATGGRDDSEAVVGPQRVRRRSLVGQWVVRSSVLVVCGTLGVGCKALLAHHCVPRLRTLGGPICLLTLPTVVLVLHLSGGSEVVLCGVYISVCSINKKRRRIIIKLMMIMCSVSMKD